MANVDFDDLMELVLNQKEEKAVALFNKADNKLELLKKSNYVLFLTASQNSMFRLINSIWQNTPKNEQQGMLSVGANNARHHAFIMACLKKDFFIAAAFLVAANEQNKAEMLAQLKPDNTKEIITTLSETITNLKTNSPTTCVFQIASFLNDTSKYCKSADINATNAAKITIYAIELSAHIGSIKKEGSSSGSLVPFEIWLKIADNLTSIECKEYSRPIFTALLKMSESGVNKFDPKQFADFFNAEIKTSKAAKNPPGSEISGASSKAAKTPPTSPRGKDGKS